MLGETRLDTAPSKHSRKHVIAGFTCKLRSLYIPKVLVGETHKQSSLN